MAESGDGSRPLVPGRPDPDAPRRKRLYFTLMGACVLLIVLAWNLVRLWSVTAAVVMSCVAAVLPPVAAIVGSRMPPRD